MLPNRKYHCVCIEKIKQKRMEANHFIERILEQDMAEKGADYQIYTRFPPEPNGFLHLGHAKAVCVNFGLSLKYGGRTNLRFDDTNPETEDSRFVTAIKTDIQWLGFQWAKECYASDYFDQLYDWALALVRKGWAYVDDSSAEQIIADRGDINTPGRESVFRDRSVEENLRLLAQMRAGVFADGAKVLRAKIDMQSPNIHLRDPVLYRIKHAAHHRTGDKWFIYPTYDFAHGQSDAIEGITHSLCSLEFVPHRPLYDWLIEKLSIFPSKQYEFARLNLSHTLMSKRKLLQLVQKGLVKDWDDPRMPTLSGLRRRGVPAEAIRLFCEKVGVAKRDNLIELSLLYHCVREVLNKTALRVMAVLDPLKVVITNYEAGTKEWLEAENNPEDPQMGKRSVPFSKYLWIERADFMEQAPKKFFRLSAQTPVRLKHAYIIVFEKAVYDDKGVVQEVWVRYVPESKSGADTSGIKAKGTIHWVSVDEAQRVAVNLYEPLFLMAEPAKAQEDLERIVNPDSLRRIEAYGESFLQKAQKGVHYQFFRKGYFYLDVAESEGSVPLVFNRTVDLKDSWNSK